MNESFSSQKNKQETIANLFSRLWIFLDKKRQRQLYWLLILMLVVSFSEMLSIGSIFPFLAALMSPEKIYENHSLKSYFNLMGIRSADEVALPLTAFFIFAIVASGFLRLMQIYVQTKVSFNIGADISIEIFRRTLYQPYTMHISRNSSEIIDGIYHKATGISSYVILPAATIISSAILFVTILSTLIFIDASVVILVVAVIGGGYGLIIKLTHKKLYLNSETVAMHGGKIVKSLQEALGGIRDVIIDGTQDIYCENFHRLDADMRSAQINSTIIGQTPRFVMETIGVSFIALLALYMSNSEQGGVSRAIPILGALALGAQRLLPIMQQGFGSWAMIRSNQVSLSDTIKLLEQDFSDEIIKNNPSLKINFNKSIKFEDVSFRYPSSSDWIIEGVSFEIPKGSRVAFIGKTGCGKSTLMDLLMGLLSPTSGNILVDGLIINQDNISLWHKHISHVPQNIFLSDSDIRSNIAFGVPNELIQNKDLVESANKAKIMETIQQLPETFYTVVGERGVRLSGGQKQRIGLARAFYKNVSLIIFDEATNALDLDTEREVMASIDDVDKSVTVIMISHRLATIKNYDLIFVVGDKKVKLLSAKEIIDFPGFNFEARQI